MEGKPGHDVGFTIEMFTHFATCEAGSVCALVMKHFDL